MRMGAAYKGTIRIRDFKLEVRPLTIAETLQVAGEVIEELKKFPSSLQNSMAEHTLLAQKTLVQATTSAPDKRDPKLTDLVVSRMTPDELHLLFKEYTTIIDRANPSLESMPVEELHRLLNSVKKSPPGLELIDLSFYQLVNLVRSLLTSEESQLAK